MNNHILTRSEQRVFDAMLTKSGNLITRDEIAQTIWGDRWLEKYSDWRIDRLIYLLRGKTPANFKIQTLRNSGYALITSNPIIPNIAQEKVEGTLPTKKYLEYMNNPSNKRKVIKDLFDALPTKVLPSQIKNILVINSYSFDNVDALAEKFPSSRVYFTNFDSRVVKIHASRIEELKLTGYSATYDDIRNSIFKDEMFDLVINDFRLNFNTTNNQNISAMKNIHRVCKPNARVLLSVVIDPRYENKKYGYNQEKAPTNKDKPWKFVAEEKLIRLCFTVPYYKHLFKNTGFKSIKEFDVKNGKDWTLPYRRFILTK